VKRENQAELNFVSSNCHPAGKIMRPSGIVIFPVILTLPGTVGRGFYVFSTGKYEGTWMFVCYTNIRKQ
jgi:hypothetical protein